MKNFKRNIVTLILTSMIMLAGVFAAGTYKNSLMALDLEQGTNGAVTLVLQTKSPYQNNINLVKRDATTYIITLPEFDSSAPSPNLIGINSVSSVKIDTRPYSSSTNGYTKITIITKGNASIFPQSKVFVPPVSSLIPDKKPEGVTANNYENVNKPQQEDASMYLSNTTKTRSSAYEENKRRSKKSYGNEGTNTTLNKNIQNDEKEDYVDEQRIPSSKKYEEEPDNSVGTWSLIILIGAIISAICMLIIGRNKMADLVGNSVEINFDDEKNENKKKSAQDNQKKSIISARAKSASTVVPVQKIQVKRNTTEQVVVEKMNVIDMDELFNAQSSSSGQRKNETSGNDALEDFLSNYYEDQSLQSQKDETTEKEESYINEELYSTILNNNNLKFSDKDISKIRVVINNELTEDIKQKIPDKCLTKPEMKPRMALSIEQIITDYVTKQNITFTGEDIEIIRKLMSVELDSDFATELKTNLKKDDMETTKAVTPPVDVKRTQQQAVNSLCEVGEYNVSVLKIDAELPDLQDVLAHPEKYEEPEPVSVAPDENALLQTLSNVQIKPFYKEEDNVNDNQDFNNDITNEDDDVSLTEVTVACDKEDMSEYSADINVDAPEAFVIPETVLIGDKSYTIKSATSFNSYAGCYLVQTDNCYIVLGYIRERVIKLKEYDTLKSEKISARINETFENGNIRYLIKIGLKKFIVDFDGNNITYVMDLC